MLSSSRSLLRHPKKNYFTCDIFRCCFGNLSGVGHAVLFSIFHMVAIHELMFQQASSVCKNLFKFFATKCMVSPCPLKRSERSINYMLQVT